jgi:NAD(P)-dependent dehydrogenase (short-subunit alcohol dehydrogenase family)
MGKGAHPFAPLRRSRDMTDLRGKKAVVVGASSGIGRATLASLAAEGARVVGVARGKDRLERLARETPGEVSTMQGDATSPEVAARILETDPDVLVVSLGVGPALAPFDAHTWETFSAAWNGDLQATFHLCREAVRRPMRPGGVVVIVSSGAAIGGSPLSGGYAGAKRMQWLLAGYARQASEKRGLGVRFTALLPHQLVVGTAIGEAASSAYAEAAGISQAKFFERWESPLLPEAVARAIVDLARGGPGLEGPAYVVKGRGMEPIS